MTLRRLDADESSVGVHTLEAVDQGGVVLARYECPCHWCEGWRSPVMRDAVRRMEQELGIERRPDWLGG